MKFLMQMLKSRTIMFALLKAIGGILVIVIAQFPEADSVGVLAIAVSLIDATLRVDTNNAISDK